MNSMKTWNLAGKGPLLGIALSVLAMAALSGCSRTYKTEYELHPPASYEGQVCVMKCERDRTQCRNDNEQQFKNCQHYNRMAGMEFERCLASGATNCYSASAPPCERPWNERCDAEYRHCYESCGGNVTSKDVCTSGWCM